MQIKYYYVGKAKDFKPFAVNEKGSLAATSKAQD